MPCSRLSCGSIRRQVSNASIWRWQRRAWPRALDLFVACYGAFAGDVALAFLARGGLYVGGGIAARLAPRLERGDFIAAFNAKGRHGELARSIPVRLIVNENLGLLGAAQLAAGEDRR
ncbi:MAG TPA: glucokinase [Burkholderiales bacterium]|nr:glucokinase [Burkholderiales bacterium]